MESKWSADTIVGENRAAGAVLVRAKLCLEFLPGYPAANRDITIESSPNLKVAARTNDMGGVEFLMLPGTSCELSVYGFLPVTISHVLESQAEADFGTIRLKPIESYLIVEVREKVPNGAVEAFLRRSTRMEQSDAFYSSNAGELANGVGILYLSAPSLTSCVIIVRAPCGVRRFPAPQLSTGETRLLQVDFPAQCSISGAITDIPRSAPVQLQTGQDELSEYALQSDAQPAADGSFEFYGLPMKALSVRMSIATAVGPVSLIDEGGRPYFTPCSDDKLLLRPAERLIGLQLRSADKQVYKKFGFTIDGSGSLVPRDINSGIVIVPREAAIHARQLAFFVAGVGLGSYSLKDAVEVDSGLFAFYLNPSSLAGDLRVILNAPGPVKPVMPELRVEVSDFGGSQFLSEPVQEPTADGVLFRGLTPNSYDLYWYWSRGAKRYIVKDVHVLAGQETLVHAPASAIALVSGQVLDWSVLPPGMRPTSIIIDGYGSTVDAAGKFASKICVPFANPEITLKSANGTLIRDAASAEFDLERGALVVRIQLQGYAVLKFTVSPNTPGRIRGEFFSVDAVPHLLGNGHYERGAIDTSSLEGHMSLVVREGEKSVGVFWEYPLEGTRFFRGWASPDMLVDGGHIELDGRFVDMQFDQRFLGGTTELMLVPVESSRVRLPTISLGHVSRSSCRLWVPSEVGRVELHDNRLVMASLCLTPQATRLQFW